MLKNVIRVLNVLGVFLALAQTLRNLDKFLLRILEISAWHEFSFHACHRGQQKYLKNYQVCV